MSDELDRIADALRRVDERMIEIDEKILGLGKAPQIDIFEEQERNHCQEADIAHDRSTAQHALANFLSPGAIGSNCTADMWDTPDGELQQLMAYVLSSSHISTNFKYAEVAERVTFVIVRDTHAVNAYSTVDEDGEKIVLLGGAIRMANLMAAAYVGSGAVRDAGRYDGNLLEEIIPDMGRYCLSCRGAISPSQACRFAKRHELHLVMGDASLSRKARSFAAGMIAGILAHEFGHLALGHCYGLQTNLETSRNTEREADSFASSVISSSPFGDYLIIGSILWESVWVWVQDTTGAIESTHPLSRERLSDLIRANPSTAAELGIKQLPNADTTGELSGGSSLVRPAVPSDGVSFRMGHGLFRKDVSNKDGNDDLLKARNRLCSVLRQRKHLTRGGFAMSAQGAQFERDLGRQGQAPAISPVTYLGTKPSVANRPSLPSFFSLDAIALQLAKMRVRLMVVQRKKEFSVIRGKCNSASDANGSFAAADCLPPRNIWKRPPASKRQSKTPAQIAELSIARTIRGFYSAGTLDEKSWGKNLLRLVTRVNEHISDAHFGFHRPRLLLKRKDAASFRCLTSYENIEDKILLYGLSSYLRERFDHFICSRCHSFRIDGKKSHHSAVRELMDYRLAHQGETLYVAECDIMKFFDAVDHREILRAYDAFAAKCGDIDPRARTLVMAYLESYSFRESVAAAIRDNPNFARNADRIGRLSDDVLWALFPGESLDGLRLGIPQGGAISPLFANILLSVADEAVVGDGSDSDLLYLRYCDDMIIVHTDRDKCKAAMDRYLVALSHLRLPVHPPTANGFIYGAEYYKLKTKEPFEWRDARMGEQDAAPWVSFLGYQINFKGEVRIRKETLEKHKKNLKAERNRFDNRLVWTLTAKGRLSLIRRYCRYLLTKGVGRLVPGSIRESARCWAAAFPNLGYRVGRDCLLQMRTLDSLRERLSRFHGDGFMRAGSHFFYGRPFSYLGYLLKMKRPALWTLRRKKIVTNGDVGCLIGMKPHEGCDSNKRRRH